MDRYTSGRCRPCATTRAVAWNRANSARSRANRDAWIERNPAENAASKARYRAANQDKLKRDRVAYYAANKDSVRAYNDGWRKANPAAWTMYSANRRAARLSATPPWADRAAIRRLYAEARERGLTVDHIVPLISDVVCGLHIPANLQMLTFSENSRKGNRL